MKSKITLSVLLSSVLLMMSGCGGGAGQDSPTSPNNNQQVDTETVVNMASVNTAPVATFNNFSINKNVAFNGQLTSKDADLDAVEYELVSACKHGTVTVDKNGCFTYTPDAGYKGKDSFSYKVKDALSACPNQVVEIDVVQAPIVTPTAPSNLKLEALTTCKVRVSWDDNSNNETGFEIYRDGELASVVEENVVTTDICGSMAPATEHKIEVRAKNIAGASSAVSGFVTTKDITTAPAAPTDLAIPAIDKTSARLTWTDNAWNESTYDIYVNGVYKKTVLPGCNCAVVTGLEAGKEYTFLVTAKNKIGSSSSKTVRATTESEPIVDVTAPVLTLLGTSPVALYVGDVYTDAGATASDDIDGNITANIVTTSTVDTSTEGNYTVTYHVSDNAGNVATLVRQVNVAAVLVDEVPTITISGEDVTLVIGDAYTDAGATASDAEDGVLTVSVNSTVDTATAGDYEVIYTATDSAGQSVSKSRSVKVITAAELHTKANIPYDSNLEIGGEDGILYYVDPRPEENGLNRALRIDYLNWSYTDLNVSGINPHSLDRAGDSDKFYVRTQNSNSFDVINFVTGEVKTVELGDHQPRAIGATNLKYHLQILSARNMQVFDIIDTTTDTIIETIGDRTPTPGVTTGHALWFDEDHFGLIDRKNKQVRVFKVVDNGGLLSFVQTNVLDSTASFHAIERVAHPRTREDLVTFYANAEGSVADGQPPFILELKFDPATGSLTNTRQTVLSQSTEKVQGISPVTHHSGISPDGRYFYAPVFDGKVYIIDRATMSIVKVLDAALGAAHIEFSDSLNLAIVTNHFSNKLTIIDLATQTVKANIDIGQGQEFHEEEKHLLQPHFSYLSKDGKKFYTFATQDGTFLEINLETLTIDRKLVTGGAPEQAHS
jgi:hypothetical protein